MRREAQRPGSADALLEKIHVGQFSQASRSARASLNTWAMACERSISSPFIRARRTLLVWALSTLLAVRACVEERIICKFERIFC